MAASWRQDTGCNQWAQDQNVQLEQILKTAAIYSETSQVEKFGIWNTLPIKYAS